MYANQNMEIEIETFKNAFDRKFLSSSIKIIFIIYYNIINIHDISYQK